MENYTCFSSSVSDNPVISPAALSSSRGAGVDDAFEDDACSICLDPFTTQDPATVTSCKHEYHLQCILEWSQRSKECPICWQLLILKDPGSQELLATNETERHLRLRNTTPTAMTVVSLSYEDSLVDQDSYSDDSDFDEHIMQHLAAAASRARYVCKRERQRSSGPGPSQVVVFTSPEHLPNAQQTFTSPEQGQTVIYGSSVGNCPTPDTSVAPALGNEVPTNALNFTGPFKPRILFRQPPVEALQGQGSSEMLSLSNSIKSKWSAATARYKESLSKSTRGIKEKLLARNNTVKELSKEVQREMNAGIAGVARMIERLDLTSKRSGAHSSDSGFNGGVSNFSSRGKTVEQNDIVRALAKKNEEIGCDTSVDASSHGSGVVPGRVEISHVQR